MPRPYTGDVGPLPSDPRLRAVLSALQRVFRTREPAIRYRVEELKAQHPGKSPDELAQILIARTRRRLATTAAASGVAAIAPGIGTIISLGTVASQSLYALEQEVELVLSIALLYGHELQGSDERLLEALLVVGMAGGAVKVREELLVAGGQKVTVAAFRRLPQAWMLRGGSHVLARLLGRVLSTRAAATVVRVAPLAVGMTAGAGFDWLAVTGLGRAAMRYYGPLGPLGQLSAPTEDVAPVAVDGENVETHG
jgi:hypothetical protein